MQLKDREPVIGTMPTIYIGHRFKRDPESGHTIVSPKWHADYNYSGRKFHEPLKTTNKSRAISAAHVIAQRIERGEQRLVQRRIDWQEFRDTYVLFLKAKGRAPKTIEKYEYVLDRLIESARKRNRLRPDAFTSADFWAFNHEMITGGLHPKTRADRLVIVKQIFKWAIKEAKPPMLLKNPIADEEIENAESSPQPCFTPEQVAKLLDRADMDHEGVVYAVLAYLGLRIGEAIELRWSDFQFDLGEFGKVWIRRGGSNDTTKNGTSRMIPLNEALRKILDRLPRSKDGRVFHQRPSKRYPDGDRPLSERRLLKSLKRLCRRCGFENPNQYKLHTFRHAFASMLARTNVPYKHALEFMGHSDSDILNLYITMFDKDAEQHIAGIRYPVTTETLT